jgi:hypothetical protein
MAMLVAPLVAQVNVLPDPELMVVGLAVKEVIAGTAFVPEDEVVAIVEPQPAITTHARGRTKIGQTFSPPERNPFKLSFFLGKGETAFMRPRFEAGSDTIQADGAVGFSS